MTELAAGPDVHAVTIAPSAFAITGYVPSPITLRLCRTWRRARVEIETA